MTNDPSTSLAVAGARLTAAPLLSLTTTLLYALMIVFALVILRSRTRQGAIGGSLVRIAVWGGFLAVLLALGFDQHIKFSREIMLGVREFARDGGWYGSRRPIQIAVLIASIAACSIAAWSLVRRSGTLAPGYRRVTIGAIALVAFVGIRGMSLHSVDSVMAYSLAGLSVGRTGETLILLAMATGFFSWVRFSTQAARATDAYAPSSPASFAMSTT